MGVGCKLTPRLDTPGRMLKHETPPNSAETSLFLTTSRPHLPNRIAYTSFCLHYHQSSSQNIMSRPRKLEDKPKDSGSLQISVEDFVRTRNSVSIIYSFLLSLICIATPASSSFRGPVSQHHRLHHTTKCVQGQP